MKIQQKLHRLMVERLKIKHQKNKRMLFYRFDCNKCELQHNSHIQMMKGKKNAKQKRLSSKNKKIISIYGSSSSLLESHLKQSSLILKKKSPNQQKIRQQPKTKAKMRTITNRAPPPQSYERISINFVNSDTCSEIDFSSCDQTQKQIRKNRRLLQISCDQQSIIEQIWRGDRKVKHVQNEAAIKIQKIFRGFLTRKLLRKYIEQQEQILLARRHELHLKSIQSQQADSFYNDKFTHSYFPSKNKLNSKQRREENERGTSNISFQLSFFDSQIENINRSRKKTIENFYSSKKEEYLNESSIYNHPQEVSVSFGNQQVTQAQKVYDLPCQLKQNDIDNCEQELHTFPSSYLNAGQIYCKELYFEKDLQQVYNNSNHKNSHIQYNSNFNSILLDKQNDNNQKTYKYLDQLRKSQKAKWQKLIQFVSYQMQQGLSTEKTKCLMQNILQFSVKNRQQLTHSRRQQQIVTQTTTCRLEQDFQEIIETQNSQIRQKQTIQNQIDQFLLTQNSDDLKSIQPPQAQKEEERQYFQESSSNSIDFSYQETNIYNNIGLQQEREERFKKVSLISPSRVDFSFKIRPIELFPQAEKDDQFLRIQEKDEDVNKKSIQEPESISPSLKKQVYKFQTDSDSQTQQTIYNESDDHYKEWIADYIFKNLIWETIKIIYCSPIFPKLAKLKTNNQISSITLQQKIGFIQSLIADLPSFEDIEERINQKMYPNIQQLLISMRQLEEEDEELEYYEIGQYEYILNQQICYEAIEKYVEKYKITRLQSLKQSKKTQITAQFRQQYQEYTDQKLNKAILQQKITKRHKSDEIQQLRQQILKIQLHCILDSWNELLIHYRQDKNGHSGIGLNQITLALKNRECRYMRNSYEYQQMMKETAQTLQQDLKNQKLMEKLMIQYENHVSKNDSQWILYTQEALQFGFDLAKAVELEIYMELIDQIKFSINQTEHEEQNQSEQNILDDDEEYQILKKIEQLKNKNDLDDSFYD